MSRLAKQVAVADQAASRHGCGSGRAPGEEPQPVTEVAGKVSDQRQGARGGLNRHDP